MKRIILLVLAGLLAFVAVQAADLAGFLNGQGKVVTRDTLTVDTQYTEYGGWDRACSTMILIAALDDSLYKFNDSGMAVYELTGSVMLSPGQKLYVGLDKMAGATLDSSDSDTGMTYTYIMNPADPGRGSRAKFAFHIVYTEAADSGRAISAPVATFATGGSSYELDVVDIVLRWYMIAFEAQ